MSEIGHNYDNYRAKFGFDGDHHRDLTFMTKLPESGQKLIRLVEVRLESPWVVRSGNSAF